MSNMIDTKKHTKQILCDTEFECYNFGPNAKVVGHTPWNTQDPARFQKNISIVFQDSTTDPDEEEVELATLFVKFTMDSKVQDAYALLVSSGEKIGNRFGFPAQGAAAGAGAGMRAENESMQDVRSTVATYLKSVGFVIDIQDPFTGLGRKSFDSAMGVKLAQVYFRESSDTDGGFVMSAEMQSEGRNCLSTCLGLIPAGADESLVIQTAAKFAQHIEKDVAASYAVRLHSNRARFR